MPSGDQHGMSAAASGSSYPVGSGGGFGGMVPAAVWIMFCRVICSMAR
jgi:hypothetical protein